VNFLTDLRLRASDEMVLVYVPSSQVGKNVGKGKTSKRQMARLKKDLKKQHGLDIEFLIHKSKGEEQVVTGLCALLGKRLGRYMGECFASFPEEDIAEIWVDAKQPVLSSEALSVEGIETAIRDYLQLFNIRLRGLHVSGPEKELPSNVVLLRVIKILAPAELDEIRSKLEGDGFDVGLPKWLEGKLDILRKEGFLLRQKDGSYVLTDVGLRLTPHGAFRSSSDIERALFLGRKKW